MYVDVSAGQAVDLAGIASADHGLGAIWVHEGGEDLNVNLVRFEAGEGVGVHRNDEMDVVFVGVAGSGEVVVDGEKFPLKPGLLVYVAKGRLRATRSDLGELAYLTVHRRREPLRLAARVSWDKASVGSGSSEGGYGMKRHPSLRKLSDDHHGGLVRARRLRRAAAGEGESPREAARAFLRFWEEDTSAHFREEEEVLLAVYARHGGDLNADPVREMAADHAHIRGLVMTLIEEDESGEVSPDTLREMGERLEAHIRLEERSVFPLLESTLTEEGLEELGARLAPG